MSGVEYRCDTADEFRSWFGERMRTSATLAQSGGHGRLQFQFSVELSPDQARAVARDLDGGGYRPDQRVAALGAQVHVALEAGRVARAEHHLARKRYEDHAARWHWYCLVGLFAAYGISGFLDYMGWLS